MTPRIPSSCLCVLGVLAAAGPASAAQFVTIVSGTMSNSANTCLNVIDLLNATDCSYAATRYPGRSVWSGPYLVGGFYERGHAAEENTSYSVSPGDGKYAVPLAGSVTVDDAGTPGIGTDDNISATWTFGAAVFQAITGNADSATESWNAWTQVIADSPVNFATANASGGFDYIIGSRGAPSPLAAAGDGSDRFASENASRSYGEIQEFWSTAGSTALPQGERIGIERSPGYGNVNGTGSPLQPNVGAQTTGGFAGYRCTDQAGDNDCTTNPLLLGVGGAGFDNLILLLSTDAAGHVTAAEAYWTREFLLQVGAPIGNDPIGARTTDNSWVGGRFTFAAVPLPASAWMFATAFAAAGVWRQRRGKAT